MLLPETKEREYRFKLALRIGLPIFALVIALISHTLVTSYKSLEPTFYFEAILLLAFSIYFIFYIIYNGFEKRITDEITKTFTREYLHKYLNKILEKEKDYTLILISIDNLKDINTRYGIKNGDKILYEVVKHVNDYFRSKGIYNYPMGHVKGGDFIIGLKGSKSKYSTVLELLCLKSEEFKVDDIEVKISGAITDTTFSNELDYMMENLFEVQEEKKNQKRFHKNSDLKPNELEAFIINAIKTKSLALITQSVFENGKSIIKECFVKLKMPDGKYIHQKSYIKVIDKLGLMIDFDIMILEKVIKVCKQRDDEIFAISISPTTLRNNGFLAKLKSMLEDNKSVHNKIMFILSETEYYSHTQKYNDILKTLKDNGVLITVDRLGSIHTSFLYLKDLDIDAVRFDTFLTKDMKIKNYKSIIEGFNVMAHAKDVKTWVRMIESEEMEKEALDIGVDYLQGKYLADVEKIYEN